MSPHLYHYHRSFNHLLQTNINSILHDPNYWTYKPLRRNKSNQEEMQLAAIVKINNITFNKTPAIDTELIVETRNRRNATKEIDTKRSSMLRGFKQNKQNFKNIFYESLSNK